MAVLIDFISLIVIGGIVALTDENKKLFAMKSSTVMVIILAIAVSGIFGAITLNDYYIYPIAVVVAVIVVFLSVIAMPRPSDVISVGILAAVYYLSVRANVSILTIIVLQAFSITLLFDGIESQVSLGAIAILGANAIIEPNGFGIGYLLPIIALVVVIYAIKKFINRYISTNNSLKIGTKSLTV